MKPDCDSLFENLHSFGLSTGVPMETSRDMIEYLWIGHPFPDAENGTRGFLRFALCTGSCMDCMAEWCKAHRFDVKAIANRLVLRSCFAKVMECPIDDEAYK